MSLLATLALAASGATLPVCSWDHPGVNPFMGDVVAAVDRYQDIPAATRDKLKARMARRDYDEIVSIKRDGIQGQARYGSDIRDMYFGQGSVCRTVTRSKWTEAMQERGLVYCEDGQCILVPTVCRNVSRIKRIAPRPVAMAAGPTPPAAAEVPPETELEMDPTGAGPGGAPSPTSFAAAVPPSLDGVPPGATPLIPNTPAGTPPLVAVPGIPSLPASPNTPVTTPPPVVVTPPAVPEPSSWVLLIGGIGLLAAVARRRRQAA